MKIVDLSHTISPGMPVYPGTEPPEISIPCTIENDGFTEKKITLYSHTGTHIDAPAHILSGAPTLDALPLSSFMGKALAIDFSSLDRSVIDLDDLAKFETPIQSVDFVLIHSGWANLWGQTTYYDGYPVLSRESAEWLANFNLKGIGVDMISIDRPDAHDLPIHRIFLSNNMVIVENLTNLSGLVNADIIFQCLPLKLETADGSPVRAVAWIE